MEQANGADAPVLVFDDMQGGVRIYGYRGDKFPRRQYPLFYTKTNIDQWEQKYHKEVMYYANQLKPYLQ